MPRQKPLTSRPNQADVARLAGVSQTTVSYVLNDRPGAVIPDETRQKVWDAVQKLNYIPNRAARSLRTQRTHIIAGIFADIENPFFPAFQRGLQDVAEQHDYSVVTLNSDNQSEKEHRALQSARELYVDGIAGIFHHVTRDDLCPLAEAGIPVVFMTSTDLAPLDEAVDRIYINNRKAARTAVSYLIGQGHTRIGMISAHSEGGKERLVGYKQTLEEFGIPVDENLIYVEDYTAQTGRRGMRHLLEQASPPTAIFTAADLIAMGAMATLREAGLDIPGDVAVIGYDDIFAAELLYPPLTTIRNDQRTLGRLAATMIIERLNETFTGPGRIAEVESELIIRGST